MKKIEAIIRPNLIEDLKEALYKINVEGITISQVMGCGKQFGWKEYYRGNEILMNTLPKIKVEIVVDDDRAESIIETICAVNQTGEIGDGKIFVYNVEECIKIRTGEKGTDAL